MGYHRRGGANHGVIAALASAGMVLLGACAGDSPESVQGALEVPVSALAYVDDQESACVSAAVVSTVGFEQLVRDGFTTDAIALDPDDSLSKILDVGDGPELRAAMTECLDVDGVARSALSELNGGALACETDFAESEISDDLLDAHFDRAGFDAFEIVDTDSNRDLLRPCLNEVAFAEAFGIDPRDELEEAIEQGLRDALGTNDDERCAAPLIIDHFGSAEATNEAGITVATPHIVLDEVIGDRSDRADIVNGVIGCQAISTLIAEEERLLEPNYFACLAEQFDGESSSIWQHRRIEAALGIDASTSGAAWERNSALDRCVGERVYEVFDYANEDLRFAARFLAEDILVAQTAGSADADVLMFGHTPADVECAAVEVVESVDLNRMYELTAAGGLDNPTVELINLYEEYSLAFGRGHELCSHDLLYVLVPGFLRNFSVDTVECARDAIGDVEALLRRFSELGADLSLNYEQYVLELDLLGRRLLAMVEGCISSDEQALFERWSSWVLGLEFGSEGAEPESLST